MTALTTSDCRTAAAGARAARLVGEPVSAPAPSPFLLEDIHPQDAATLLDMQGIALRVGHHCAMPLMESLGIGGTMRASLACYNNPGRCGRPAGRPAQTQ